LRKRVHILMKTTGRCCKKVQRVSISRLHCREPESLTLKNFGSMVIPLPPLLQKRGWKVDMQGLGVEKSKKKRLYFVENISGSLQRECKR